MKIFKKIHDLLSANERKQALLVLTMVMAMALLDALGVASIMPFMAVLAEPSLVESNVFLSTAYRGLGFADVSAFLMFLGFIVLALLVVSLMLKGATTYVQLRFVLMRECSIGIRLVEGYLSQPYVWFLNRNSADLGKTILSEVDTVIRNGLNPAMILVAQSVVSVTLLALLIIVDPLLAVSIFSVLGMTYIFIFVLMRRFLARIGQERVKVNKERFSSIGEAFGAVKEIKFGGLEKVYINRFSASADTYARNHASAQAIAQIPRFALEAIAFGGMLVVVLVLMSRGGTISSTLPVMALYAFAGYRLMPALQQIYHNATLLRFVAPAIDALHADIISLKIVERKHTNLESLKFNDSVEMKGIRFNYPETEVSAVADLSLIIPVHSTVALVGMTGSGKTTTVDLLLSLLEAQEGELLVDGTVVNDSNRSEWQSLIGYVPQQIYLSDDTLAANIALGVSPGKIDYAAVELASKLADIHDFITLELPNGYSTGVGERGVKLSGGQRQRIGIARALYHKPKLLILDEATSALDSLTEQRVMKSLTNLEHKVTTILIAHRLSTVRNCDQIYLLNKGKVEAHGTFDELLIKNQTFRDMVSK